MVCTSGSPQYREDLAAAVKEHFADIVEAVDPDENEEAARIGKFVCWFLFEYVLV